MFEPEIALPPRSSHYVPVYRNSHDSKAHPAAAEETFLLRSIQHDIEQCLSASEIL